MFGTRLSVGVHRSSSAPEKRGSRISNHDPTTTTKNHRPSEEAKQRKGQTYKLDRHLLVVQEVCALEDDTERALTDFLPYAIVDAHNIR